MNKFTKIAVSFLLIISLVINPFGSIFDIKASALDPVSIGTIILYILEKAAEGFVIGQSAVLGAEVTDEIIQAYDIAETQKEAALTGARTGVGYQLSDTGLRIEAYRIDNADLTEDEAAFADFAVDYVNSNFIEVNTLDGVGATLDDYKNAKNLITNAYNEYMSEKLASELKEANINELASLLETAVPTYAFDFVGPMPTLSVPNMNKTTGFSRDGYVFSTPMIGDQKGEVELKSVGGEGYYFLYNNDIFAYGYSYSYLRDKNIPIDNDIGSRNMYNSAGVSLKDAGYTGFVYDLPHGYYYMELPSLNKVPWSVSPSEEDFTTTVGGVLEVPRTEQEETVGNALGLGLISPGSTLEFADDGSIASADGIEIAKLQELIDLISSGNLQFDNIQEYLDLITQLVSSGNLTATQQKSILENINENVKSIEDVNTSIKQLVDIFNVSNAVVPKPQFVHDNLIGGGFPEAEALIKEALPVVNQAKDLIGNLFNWNDNVQEPPNFSFYWDSNKDGETEKYTVLDLSFMEQTLTNSNLEDKGRFVNPMTIREFVQSLIVLITYAVFAVKIFRKIPGLIGGSESVADDIRTVCKE